MFFRRYRSEIMIALATLAIAACWVPIRMRFPFDDAYITFRYSANVAHGFGIVWNPGGAHTEGYTNFLLMLLFVPFSSMGWDLMVVSQTIALIAVVISAVALFRMAEAWKAGVLVAAFFLLDPFVWFNACSGLETTLFTMWVVLALYATHRTRPLAAFLFATFAALTRPEGVLVGVAVLFGFMWELPAERHRILRACAIAFVLPLACYGAWKLAYFGTVMPNSFYVKISQAQRFSLLPGLRNTMRFYGGMLPVFPFAVYAVWQLIRQRAANSMLAIVGGLCIILPSIVYLFSQPLMAFYGRFTNSIEAILLLFGSIGMVLSLRHRRFQMVAIIGIVITQLAAGLMLRQGYGTLYRDTSFEEVYRQIAPVLRSIPDHEHITLAWADAGVLPYYSGLRFLDVVGLNETPIAHATNANEVYVDIISSRPELIIIPLTKDSSTVFRGGHGFIGSLYGRLNEWAMASGYCSLARMPQSVYDMELLADTTSSHYRDIAHTIDPHVGKDPHFLPPFGSKVE